MYNLVQEKLLYVPVIYGYTSGTDIFIILQLLLEEVCANDLTFILIQHICVCNSKHIIQICVSRKVTKTYSFFTYSIDVAKGFSNYIA